MKPVAARPSALVLMPTFNGEAFLREQIDSILAQEDVDLYLLARDDGSSDATPALLAELAASNDRFTLLCDQRGRLGYAGNFAALLDAALLGEHRLFLLSDQDDLWQRSRAKRQIALLESTAGSGENRTPCMCHSDLSLIDGEGHAISASFLSAMQIRHEAPARQLPTLLSQNFVTGCTVAMNRELLALALPFSANARNHDHWLALCAACYGMLLFDPLPLVAYRQHQHNAIGASGIAQKLLRHPVKTLGRALEHLDDTRRMALIANELLSRNPACLKDDAKRLLQSVVEILSSGRSGIQKKRALQKIGVEPQNTQRRFYWMLSWILGR